MSLLGNAIGRIASKAKGQCLLELPDDLGFEVVNGIVTGANEAVTRDPAYALFVQEPRGEELEGSGSVDFRELAKYREGDRLAIVHASENRGMATYTSVFPLLFAPGFPSSISSSGANGIVELDGLVDEIALVLAEVRGGDDALELGGVLRHAMRFLTDAYQYAGNGQTSLAADWWCHIDCWVEDLAELPPFNSEATLVRQVYGSAGLPCPSQGVKLSMRPKDYVDTLAGRWSGPLAIRQELLRLEGLPSAAGAASQLASIDWEDETAGFLLQTDSQIVRVALAGRAKNGRPRYEGWSSLTEGDFRESYAEAKGKLSLELNGTKLPRPWGDALPVLRLVSRANPKILVQDLGILIPWKGEVPNFEQLDPGKLEVKGIRGTSVHFHLKSHDVRPQGWLVTGTLEATLSARSASILALETRTFGTTAATVADRADGVFAIMGPRDVVLQVRRTSKGSGPKNVFKITSPGEPSVQVKLGVPGKHEVAIAFGEEITNQARAIDLDQLEVESFWPQSDREGLVVGRGDLARDQEVRISDETVFRLELSATTQRALSPIVAAANGTLPDHASSIEPTPLGTLETRILACLAAAGPGRLLGAFVTKDSRERHKFFEHQPGVHIDSKLVAKVEELTPKMPSEGLASSPEYGSLVEAYKELGLVDHIAGLEEKEGIADVTPSRVSLTFIPKPKIDRLLGSYLKLIEAFSDKSDNDYFWARHPFSVAVYGDGIGTQELSAVLLSPLHPIRLAWLWRLQVGLNASNEDEGDPGSALALLDNTLFPANGWYHDGFGDAIGLLPLQVDAYPSEVYAGWQVLVPIKGNRISPPQRLNGDHFPITGLSGLSSSAVSSAIDDFLRVAPHVRSLRLAVEAVESTRRSSAIDDGLMAKIASLAASSGTLAGVGGVQVLDSKRRLGAIPSFESIAEDLQLARPEFNARWTVSTSLRTSPETGSSTRTHLSFLEGLAANIAIKPIKFSNKDEEPNGWLPEVPLKRFPIRRRPSQDQTSICYALGSAPEDDLLWGAMRHYETAPASGHFELRIKPNLAGLPTSPNWFVSGDFGIDPQTIASAAGSQGAGRYMLWDWRPAVTVASGAKAANLRSQPYFVMASVPPSLTASVSERLQRLDPSLDQTGITDRVALLVRTLATRAVGLNTLLAIGHHQATGALGFYFALRSLEKWANDAPAKELRLVVPIDATDAFLRSIASRVPKNKRKADLLAIKVKCDGDGVNVRLVPIEIKHYGLNKLEQEPSFPDAGSASLREHLEQLQTYQAQLHELCNDYRNAASDQVSIMGQQLAAIIDAALQLSPKYDRPLAERVLSSLACGTAKVELGKGLFLWYQPGASFPNGARAKSDEIFGPPDTRRIQVWIDPAHYGDEFWDDADQVARSGGAHSTFIEAIELASSGSENPGPLRSQQELNDLGGVEIKAEADKGVTIGHENVPTREPEASDPHSVVRKTEMSLKQEESTDALAPAGTAGAQRMSPEDLDKTYRRLMEGFAEFKVSVLTPDDGDLYKEGPAFIEFAIKPDYGVSVRKVESQLENVKLRLGLPDHATIGCTNHLGRLLLTVPKAETDRYFVRTSDIWRRWQRPPNGFHIPLGEDINGDIVSIEFSNSNSPHLLIAGTTGSGKSEALLTLLRGATNYYSMDELKLHLIDPKRVELASLKDLPHCAGDIGFSATDALRILGVAASQMDQRYVVFEEHGVRDIDEYQSKVGAMDRQLIVLDEYGDLTTDDDDRKAIEKELARLAQKARAAGIHVIVSTQKPVVSVINTVIKGNLPARVALSVSNGTESRVVLDENGAEALAGKGDAYLKIGSKKVRLQFAYYDGL